MEQLKTIQDNWKLKSTLRRLGDLENVDGPVLSVYQSVTTRFFYLFDHIDSNETSNRWLIYQVQPRKLFQYIEGKATHWDMFMEPLQRPRFWIADIFGSYPGNYDLQILAQSLPEKYQPKHDVTFRKEDAINLEVIRNALLEALSSENSFNTIYNGICLKSINNQAYTRPIGYKFGKMANQQLTGVYLGTAAIKNQLNESILGLSHYHGAGITFNNYPLTCTWNDIAADPIQAISKLGTGDGLISVGDFSTNQNMKAIEFERNDEENKLISNPYHKVRQHA